MSERETTQNTEANNQEETTDAAVEIKDLEATGTEDVKGGPKKIFIGGLS